MVNDSAVMWRSAKQSIVVASVAEAELVSLKETVLQLQWLRILLRGIEAEQLDPTPIFTDSKVAMDMVMYFGQSRASRHACVTLAVVQEAVESMQVVLCKLASEHNDANMFTKALARPKLRELFAKFGLELPLSSFPFTSP